MSSKTIVTIGVLIGSSLGGYLPVLWGGTPFSVASVLLSAVGGTIGLVITYQLVKE